MERKTENTTGMLETISKYVNIDAGRLFQEVENRERNRARTEVHNTIISTVSRTLFETKEFYTMDEAERGYLVYKFLDSLMRETASCMDVYRKTLQKMESERK